MKKYILYAVVLGALIPSVTFAAWYNPFSWFKKPQTSISSPTEPVVENIQVPSKPVITNTITVENPKLQAQINALIQSNTDLQVQLSAITAKYNTLVSQNIALSAQVKELTEKETDTVIADVVKDNQIIVSKVSQKTGNTEIKFLNNSEQSVGIIGITVAKYGGVSSLNVKVSTVNGSTGDKEVTFTDSKSNIYLDSALYMPAHGEGKLTIYGNVDNLVGLIKTRQMDILGLPLKLY